jgi:hypothetical protein
MPKSSRLLQGCSYRIKTDQGISKRATHKLFDYNDNELDDTVVWTHKDTPVNEVTALTTRHQLDTGAVYSMKNEIYDNFKLLKRRNNGTSAMEKRSKESVISSYSGRQAKEYEAGRLSLDKEFLNKKDGRIRMFLKDDKYETKTLGQLLSGEENKFASPRCIQYRNKRYSLLLAQYIKAVEAEACTYSDDTNTHVFAKGRNLTERANDLRSKWDSFMNPVAICMDHSKFDCHIKIEHLRQEHATYLDYFEDKSLLKFLLRMQLKNKGCTKNGTTYITKGTRMSGDQNTSMGNSIINYGMLKEAFKKIKAGFYVDGDDSVVIIDRMDYAKVNFGVFAKFGMNTKKEEIDIFERVDFCQCRPVFDGVSWQLARNPWRALVRLPWTVKRAALPIKAKYVRSVGLCEIACSYGLPILQAIGWSMVDMGSGEYVKTDRHWQANLQKVKPVKVQRIEVKYETRLSYALAWDVSVEEQIRLESLKLSWGTHASTLLLEEVIPSGMTL